MLEEINEVIVKRRKYKLSFLREFYGLIGTGMLMYLLYNRYYLHKHDVRLNIISIALMSFVIADGITYLSGVKVVEYLNSFCLFAMIAGTSYIKPEELIGVKYWLSNLSIALAILVQVMKFIKLKKLEDGTEVVRFSSEYIGVRSLSSKEFIKIKWTEIKNVSFKSKGCNKIYLNIKKEYRELYCEKTILGFRKNYVTIMGESIDTEFRALGEKIQGINYHKNCDQMEKRIEEHVGRN